MKQKILQLKKEKNALILAHYYQLPEIWDVADFVGDSFDLAKIAKEASCDIIVFCGVRFMAESAKLLNSTRKVLLAASGAGCPMADMVTPEQVDALRKRHPNAAVVCYVNSTAAVKAKSDICCTSSNALQIIRSLPNHEIIFIPDQNLGRTCAESCPEKTFYYIDGCCPIHNNIYIEDVSNVKKNYPDAVFLAHPECRPEVSALADFVGSTKQIIQYALKTSARKVIIGTEQEIVSWLRRLDSTREYIPLTNRFICADMKKTTLGGLKEALEKEQEEIFIPTELAQAASLPLEKMVAKG
mgnify:CR=1 FL=1